MKIIEVFYHLQNGGAQRLIVDLSNELSLNHEVVLLTILDDKIHPERRNFYRFDLSEGVRYENLGIRDGFNISALFKVNRFIRKEKADIVHLHGVGMPAYFILPLYFGCGKTRFYQTIHSDVHNGYDRGFAKFALNTVGRTGRLKYACLSPQNFKNFTNAYPKTTFKCILNGRAPMTPTNEFENVRKEMQGYKANKDSRLFLHIASCSEVKNQRLLFSSFNSLIDMGCNADLVIIGKDFDTNRGKDLLNMACSRIHYIGQRRNIPDYVLNADIFCLSSNYEGMPITLLEAGLAGMPAVCTPVCGAVDVIQNGVNGILSADHSEYEYTKALKEAYDNYDSLHENAMKMRDTAPYTIKECTRKYIEYFNDYR